LSAILDPNWVDIGLFGETKTFGSTRIVSGILLFLLGWLGIFAQTTIDSDPAIVPAQKERLLSSGDPEFTFARMIYASRGSGVHSVILSQSLWPLFQ
jgi:hypothetical protein